jgi:glutathione S-transferase
VGALRLIVGNKNLSSWSLRPWVLLTHAGIPFDEEVRLFETDRWRETIGDVSPSGRVPVLLDGDLAVWESIAIAEYVADRFPEKALWPRDRVARAHARAVSAEMHAGFPHMRRDLSMDVAARYPRRRLAAETERDVRRVQAIWSDCRARATGRGAEGPFLFGAFSIADAMFAPVVFRFRGYDVPFPVEHAAARAYQETMLALPAMQAWERDARAEVDEASSRGHGHRLASPTSAQHVYAVIFSSKRRSGHDEEYERVAASMEELARRQPGFLAVETARGADGLGITVSYWDSLEAIRAWKSEPEHLAAQARGKTEFYERYEIRVASVERGYRFP